MFGCTWRKLMNSWATDARYSDQEASEDEPSDKRLAREQISVL